MERVEPIQEVKSLTDIIKDTPVNGEVQVHADRLGSFKSTLNRVNKDCIPKILFSYTGVKNDYSTAKRIA